MKFRVAAFLIGITAFVPATTGAQEHPLWLHGGLAITNLRFDVEGGSFDPDRRLGLVAGLILAGDFRSGLGMHVEVNYFQAGATFEAFGGFQERFSFRTHYLEVPIFVRVRRPGSSWWPFFLAGPVLSFKLADKQELGEQTLEGNQKLGVRNGDVAFGVGTGVGGRRLMFSVRATYGLLNVNPDSIGFDVRNRAVVFTFAVRP